MDTKQLGRPRLAQQPGRCFPFPLGLRLFLTERHLVTESTSPLRYPVVGGTDSKITSAQLRKPLWPSQAAPAGTRGAPVAPEKLSIPDNTTKALKLKLSLEPQPTKLGQAYLQRLNLNKVIAC